MTNKLKLESDHPALAALRDIADCWTRDDSPPSGTRWAWVVDRVHAAIPALEALLAEHKAMREELTHVVRTATAARDRIDSFFQAPRLLKDAALRALAETEPELDEMQRRARAAARAPTGTKSPN